MQAVRKMFQKEQHFINTPPDTQWYQTLSLSILWEEISSEVRHEEAHIYSHRFVFNTVYIVTMSIDKGWPSENESTQWVPSNFSSLATSLDLFVLLSTIIILTILLWINILFSISSCRYLLITKRLPCPSPAAKYKCFNHSLAREESPGTLLCRHLNGNIWD